MWKILLLPALAFLTACQTGNLAFQIEYDDIDGLTKGAPLTYEDNPIGSVREIEYTDQGVFLVGVEIDKNFRHLANHSSLFYVSEDSNANKIVELEEGNPSADQSPIESGELIQGHHRMAGMSQKLQNQFSSAIESLSSSIQDSWENWREETLDQQLQLLEEELDRMQSKAQELSESMRQDYETRILPELKAHIETLRKELEELGREDEMDSIEQKMDNLEGLIEA